MRHALLPLLLCSLAFVAQAKELEDVPLYDGAWSLRGPGSQAARLVISQWDGSWRETGANRWVTNAACRGKPFPVTVHHSNTAVLEFTAWGSAVGPACPDISFTMKPVDARTLRGTTGGGEQVTMSRAGRK